MAKLSMTVITGAKSRIMKTELRKMNKEEYEAFYRMSFESMVNELVREKHITVTEAQKETASELDAMLPLGMDTRDNFLMTIIDRHNGEQKGYIWTVHEYSDSIKQSFLCDLLIYEEHRRKGYAKQAIALMEDAARAAGCVETVLFVSDDNTAAIALYEKCGYHFLREMDYGKYMKKIL